MLETLLSALIPAASKLIGGSMSDKATEQNNLRNIQAEEKRNQDNIALQREFAQTGIQWKVEDAKKAGIHPAYALGAPTSSVSVTPFGAQSTAKSGLSGAVSDMGQDIERAVYATSPAARRAEAYTEATQKLAIERGGLENLILKADLASKLGRTRQANGVSKPIPSAYPAPPTFAGVKIPKEGDNDDMKTPPAPEHSGLRAGQTWLHNPNWSDAQKFEDRYGDLGEFIASMLVFGGDVKHNVSNEWNRMQFLRNRSSVSSRPYRRRF